MNAFDQMRQAIANDDDADRLREVSLGLLMLLEDRQDSDLEELGRIGYDHVDMKRLLDQGIDALDALCLAKHWD